MSEFTKSTITFTYIGGIEYKTDQELTWHIGHLDGPKYVIPKDYIFDVSIPRALYWLYSPHQQTFLKAAAIHDHMLEAGWDRITAGAAFHEALKSDGVHKYRRLTMWLAVSLWDYA